MSLVEGKTGCPEMSVINYHYSLYNNPQEPSSQSYRLKNSEGKIKVCAILQVVCALLTLWSLLTGHVHSKRHTNITVQTVCVL
jgi:hypothetical protein